MSIQEAATVARANFPASISVTTPHGTYALPVVMVAIAGAESGWNPQADGDCGLDGPACGTCPNVSGGATSWGLWQIHNVHAAYLTQATGSTNPCTWRSWLFVPANNAKAAWALWGGNLATFLGNWSTWSNKAYIAHLSAAQTAYQAATASSATSPFGSSGSPLTSAGSVTSRLTRSGEATILASGVAVAALAIVAIETDWHWSQIREALRRRRRNGTIKSERGDTP